MLSQVIPPFQERVFVWAQLKDSINKENKGNFGFLKIDATNAVFVGFGGPPENADSSYLSQTDSLSYGAFVQVLGTFDQKNGAYNLFSSFIEASWLMCQGSIPFANFLAPAFCWSILGFDLSSLKWWPCDGGEVSIPCKIAESTVPTNRKENFLHFQELNLDLPKKIVDTLFPLYVINSKSLLRHWLIGSLPAKNH